MILLFLYAKGRMNILKKKIASNLNSETLTSRDGLKTMKQFMHPSQLTRSEIPPLFDEVNDQFN